MEIIIRFIGLVIAGLGVYASATVPMPINTALILSGGCVVACLLIQAFAKKGQSPAMFMGTTEVESALQYNNRKKDEGHPILHYPDVTKEESDKFIEDYEKADATKTHMDREKQR